MSSTRLRDFEDFDTSNQEIVDVERAELEAAHAIFAEKAKVTGVTPSPNFGSLLPDTKMRKVYAMKKLTNANASVIAPNHQEELMTMYKQSIIPKTWNNSTKGLTKALEAVAEQYEKAPDRKSREIVLSCIVNAVGLRELQNFIPGVSSRKYHKAKIIARTFGPFIEPMIRRTRYEPIKLHYYVSFITSPIISTGIPYGERKVKTSDGSSVSIPNTIRLHRNAEIIRIVKMNGIGDGRFYIDLSGFTRNIIRHMEIGRHRILPEKIHIYDYALGLFKRNLEDVQAHNNVLSEVSQAMTEMSHGADLSSKAGWALRLKRKRGVYPEKAKRFAEKLFQRGDVSGRKMDPAEIRSYFGTLSKEKKAAKEPKAPKRRKTQDKNEEDENEYEEMMNEDDEEDYGDLSDEDEENIDDFGRERNDVIHDIIRESFNELFNENDDPIIDDDV
ncbi:hypothetical protein PRIPAC_97449 [Pristionchus pacificus]|uniref:NAD(P)H-hydrate epimerase n=1 Tax=Pristionchus pacificus TaxID=54126 RepID=A0A2A6CUZ2_PRIPA|nr:hypothetical protein PRIPAC_97449 [Pristionchus pacificus]|eukprot:PDM81863.1 hypothetical protein PRIPAC_34017 [Pristionchus pacificus]